MTSRNRETLRNYFGDGKLPTRYHFADLIDSMLNMSDEGFAKSPQNGIELSAPVTQDALVSFYREQKPKTVLWSMAYGGGHDLLHFQPGSVLERKGRTPVLALDREARVGVNTANPRHTLEVAGVVASEGRRGTYELGRKDGLLADGEWKDITETLHGCQAFEVMAGVGSPGKGRYALLHAIALNTYNPTAGWLDFFSRKKRIRTCNAWYGRRCDRLQLCWEGSSGDNAAYKLRIRTGCKYGQDERGRDVHIKVLMTRLWFDETTQEPGT